MLIEELISKKVITFKNKSMTLHYSSPKRIIDDGEVLRINDLQIIIKSQIEDISKENNWIKIKMKNGEIIQLEVI